MGSVSNLKKSTHLYELVPTRADNDRVLGIWAESDARDPVSVSLLSDRELAVSEGVPQLDRPVARSRHDLPVVGREGDGENVVVVSDKPAGSCTGRKLPEAESLVPGGRESICTVRGDDLNQISALVFQCNL